MSKLILNRKWAEHAGDLGGPERCMKGHNRHMRPDIKAEADCPLRKGMNPDIKAEADCPCGITKRHRHCPGCGNVLSIGDWDPRGQP